MISSINNIQQSVFQPQSYPRQDIKSTFEPLNSFADEDTAIISSEAKLQYELEKFNAGGSNDVDLAVANVVTKNTVSAEINVVQTKKDMIDVLLNMGD